MTESNQLKDSDYQSLSEIQTSMDLSSGDYEFEYPSSLDNIPTSPSQSDQEQATSTSGTAAAQHTVDDQPIYENLSSCITEEEDETCPLPVVDDSDSDFSEVERNHISIKQTLSSKKRTHSQNGRELENSNIIYINGSLPHPPVPEGRIRSLTDELTGSLSGQGIYQGLASGVQQRGIMPESVLMATNLLENLGEEIGQLDVVDELEEAPGEHVEEGRRKFGSTTDPNVFKPKIRKQQHRASAPAVASSSTTSDVVAPCYRSNIVRPPPLPPITQPSTLAERKAYSVIESLLKSEASLLSSLHIAIEVYMKPLNELSLGPSPILTQQQVHQLFGTIEQILADQELFYLALTSRTLTWNSEQKIGDIFLSSLATKEVIRHYSSYVNNFTAAMAILEQGLTKKGKLVTFLQDKYQRSNTSLSLQGLLLKPIQRFPQYIMFIKDLLKYSPHTHPDRITLQMALARFEGIANYLNESKRVTEKRSIVDYLSSRVAKLPFKLKDSMKRWLHRQDVVTRLLATGSKVQMKQRFLLLFNNMVLCAAPVKKTNRHEDLESTTGSRLFQGIGGSYSCKWYAPVDSFEIIDPDYHNDIWDQYIDTALVSDIEEYKMAKASYTKLEHDFNMMTTIAASISKLHHDYEGMTTADVNTHIRVLLRKLAKVREMIQAQQVGRIDISIPSREGSDRVVHTYVFPNERVKSNWISTLRYTKLKLNKRNKDAWVTSEDTNDEDFFDLSHKLPLVVESYRLSMLHTLNAIHCGTKVEDNNAWLASGCHNSAQITVVQCVTPCPLVLESFTVESNRILDIVYAPAAALMDSTLTATMRRVSLRESLKNLGTLTNLPPHLGTVWMGTECGRLLVYSSESIEDGTKKCLSSIKFRDAITSLQYYKDQIIISTAEGNVVIFKRNFMGWNLTQKTTIAVHSGAIRCTCLVKNKLWIGADNICYFLNLQTHKVEGSKEMSESRVMVSKMVCWGEGVWVCFKGSSSLELFHTVTKNSLQNIDVKSTLNSILKRRDLLDRHPVPDHVHVTALLVSSGYFWIGTSVGIIMIYRIPMIEGVPLINAKPYLAMDGHKGQVRIILTVKTEATLSSIRVTQFLKAEQRDRHSNHSIEENQRQRVRRAIRILRDQTDRDSLSPEGSPAPQTILLREEDLHENVGFEHTNGNVSEGDDSIFNEDTETLVRSTTPTLPPPSTLELEASVYDNDSNVPLYTPVDTSDDEGTHKLENGDHSLRPRSRQITPSTTRPSLGELIKHTNPKEPSIAEDESAASTCVEDSPDGQQPEPEGNMADIELQTIADLQPRGDIEMISITGIEESLDCLKGFPDFAPEEPKIQLPDVEIINPTGPEDSLDYLVDKPDSSSSVLINEGASEEQTASEEATDSSQSPEEQPEVRQDLEGSEEYDSICEATLLSRQKPTSALEEHRTEDLYLVGDESLDGYNDPVELDALTMRRVPSEELSEPVERDRATPTPYVAPATLARSGPLSANKVFTSTFVRDSQPKVTGRSKHSKEEAIYVLTCGRGLIDLRSGAKTGILFPTARSSVSQEDKQEDGCILAYEIEQ